MKYAAFIFPTIILWISEAFLLSRSCAVKQVTAGASYPGSSPPELLGRVSVQHAGALDGDGVAPVWPLAGALLQHLLLKTLGDLHCHPFGIQCERGLITFAVTDLRSTWAYFAHHYSLYCIKRILKLSNTIPKLSSSDMS